MEQYVQTAFEIHEQIEGIYKTLVDRLAEQNKSLKSRLENLGRFAIQYHSEDEINSAEAGVYQVICKGCDKLRWVGLHPVTDEIHSYCEECIERLNTEVEINDLDDGTDAQ